MTELTLAAEVRDAPETPNTVEDEKRNKREAEEERKKKAAEDEERKKAVEEERAAARLRAWGHVAAVGVLILALFAFGLELTTDASGHTHLHPRWSEVAAILIVFVLAELGIELVGGAQILSSRMESAKKSVQGLTRNTITTVESVKELQSSSHLATQQLVDRLEGVRKSVDGSVHELKSTVTRFTGGLDLLQEGAVFAHQTGNVAMWNTLASFIRKWNDGSRNGDDGAKKFIGHLFEAFIGPHGSVDNTATSVTCATIDSVYANVSSSLLEECGARKQDFVVWAISSLHPFEFCVPRLFWSGSARRVSALETFVKTVTTECLHNIHLSEYRRLTVFTEEPNVEFPSVRGAPSTSVNKALDRWLVWSSDQVDEDLRKPLSGKSVEMAKWLSKVYGAAGDGLLTADDLRDEITEARRKPQEVYSLPDPREAGKMHRYYIDPHLAVAYVPDGVLPSTPGSAALTMLFQEAAVTQSLASETLPMDDILYKAGWLSIRKWYTTRIHKGATDTKARWTLVKPSTTGVNAFRIKLDERDWKTLDLILIGTPSTEASPHWLAAILSDIDLDNPACVVKLVIGQDDLQEIGNGVEELFNLSNVDGGSWEKKAS